MSGSFPGKSSMVLPKIVPPVPQEQIAHQRQVRIQLHPPVGVHGTNNVPKYTKRHHELPKGKILVQPRVSGLNHRRKPIPRHQRLITLRGRQNKTHQINITAGTDREARAVVIVPDTPPPAMLSTARILASMACIEPARDCSDARMRPESEEPPGTAVSAGWLSAAAALLFAGPWQADPPSWSVSTTTNWQRARPQTGLATGAARSSQLRKLRTNQNWNATKPQTRSITQWSEDANTQLQGSFACTYCSVFQGSLDE
ncbi:uncharacterized protein LOC120571777 [Perca fluviatilis]|uniref:uncharacterized protein LOC120571777 n=1 Tax=Perca fluviatilis TaxID=8168 RepID=UPI0019653106|nr:uncharacterized protein LOC120571777 [Perca fluviatilis]